MNFEKITKEEFTKFAENHPLGTFYQTVEMEEVSNIKKWKSEYFGVKKNGVLVAASRILIWENRFQRKYFYAQRGPLLDYEDDEILVFFIDNIKKYIKKEKGYIFRIDPTIIYKERDIDGNIVENGINNEKLVKKLKKLGFKHQGFNKELDFSKQVRLVFCLDIENKSETEVFKNMKQNHRNIINKTEKFAIEIREISYDELPIYKKITEETGERKNFADKSFEYYQAVYNSFGKKGKAKFLIAYLNVKKYINNLTLELEKEQNRYEKSFKQNQMSGKTKELKINVDSLNKRLSEASELLKENDMIPLSAALFMLHNGEIDYLFSGSYKKYLNFYAQYAIQWYMIKYGIKNKFKIYNFYGISGVFDKTHHDYGVYEFKKGFNGKVIEYIGDFELPITCYYYVNKIFSKINKK